MYENLYDIGWVGRCTFADDNSDHDKIWGWFRRSNDETFDYFYTFWGRTGKTLSFKKDRHRHGALSKLEKTKTKRHYKNISVEELLEIWPTFYEDLTERFVTFSLINN